MAGDAGSRTPDISHAKRTLFHWATSPRMIAFEISFQKPYLQHRSKKIICLEKLWVEPRTFRTRSERSTPVLHPHGWLLLKSLFRNLIYNIDRRRKMTGDAGSWTQDISDAKRTLYHWATSPGIIALEMSFQKPYLQHRSKKIKWLEMLGVEPRTFRMRSVWSTYELHPQELLLWKCLFRNLIYNIDRRK